jgi:hypothetical protein
MHYLDVGDTVEGEVRWCCTASGFVMPLTSGLCWKTSHWTCRRGSTTGSPDLLALAKTTILRLISGLYTPERGTVRIDDRDPVVDSAPTLYLPQFVQLYRARFWRIFGSSPVVPRCGQSIWPHRKPDRRLGGDCADEVDTALSPLAAPSREASGN